MADDEFDGALDNEHEENEDKDMKDKVRRIERKFNAFLDDIADDVIEPELLEKVGKTILKKLRKAGVSPGFMSIKSFALGFDFGMSSTMQLEGGVAHLMIAIHRYVKERTPKKAQVEIDITKSLPLEDHGEETK